MSAANNDALMNERALAGHQAAANAAALHAVGHHAMVMSSGAAIAAGQAFQAAAAGEPAAAAAVPAAAVAAGGQHAIVGLDPTAAQVRCTHLAALPRAPLDSSCCFLLPERETTLPPSPTTSDPSSCCNRPANLAACAHAPADGPCRAVSQKAPRGVGIPQPAVAGSPERKTPPASRSRASPAGRHPHAVRGSRGRRRQPRSPAGAVVIRDPCSAAPPLPGGLPEQIPSASHPLPPPC